MYFKVGQGQYFLLAFTDEYSRYIVHSELLSSMDGRTVTHAMQRALKILPRDDEGQLQVKPEIRSDNGSGYISRDFYQLLAHHDLAHQRITPGCPEENGIMERANRTMREARKNRRQAEDALSKIIKHHNQKAIPRCPRARHTTGRLPRPFGTNSSGSQPENGTSTRPPQTNQPGNSTANVTLGT